MPRSRSTASRATRPSRGSSAPSAVRVTEAFGASSKSWDDAVLDAVRSAKDDAPDPIAVEVVRFWADIGARGRLAAYRAHVKIAFRERLVAPARERATRSRAVTRRSPTVTRRSRTR